MDFWKILGIEPTVDTKIIKRAYASKLKIFHPEEDPEGFQMLRKAYENVLQEVKNQNKSEKLDIQDDDDNYRYQQEIEIKRKSIFIEDNQEALKSENLVDKFMNNVEKIYNNFFQRIDENQWRALLEDESFLNLEIKQTLNYRMLTFLMDNYHLPRNIWTLLNDYFFWTEQEEDLYVDFPESFIKFIMAEICCSWGLSYDFFKEDYECDYDEFIYLRHEAYIALMDNELKETWEHLQSAKKVFDEDPDLINMLGKYYLRIEDEDKALEAFSKLIELNPRGIDGYLNKANILMKKKLINEAYADYKKVVDLDSDNVVALTGIAQCYLYLNHFEESKLLYKKLIEKYPYNIDLRLGLIEVNNKIIDKLNYEILGLPNDNTKKYELAKVYFELDNFEKCCEILSKIGEKQGFTSKMYFLLGCSLAKLEKMDEAIDYFNKALENVDDKEKNIYEIVLERGKAYLEREKYYDAVDDFKKALEINKFDDELLYNLAETYRQMGKAKDCVSLVNEAIKINPSNWLYYSTRGLAYYELNDYEAAKNDHTVVVNYKYSFAYAWYRKGYCHLRLGEFEEAIESFRTAIDWNDEMHVDVYFNLAYCYFSVGEMKEALNEIKIYKQQEVDDCFGYIFEGDIYRAMGNIKEARRQYLKAYQVDSTCHQTIKLLSYFDLVNKDYKSAVEYLSGIYNEDCNEEWIMINLAWACLENKDFKLCTNVTKAYFKNMEKASKQYNPYMLVYAGIAFYELGLYNDSIKNFKNAIEYQLTSDVYSYLSMTYYDLGDMEKAISFAKKALNEERDNVDYKNRYEMILKYKDKKTFLGIFNKRPSSKKICISIMPLKHHDLEELPALNFEIGGRK